MKLSKEFSFVVKIREKATSNVSLLENSTDDSGFRVVADDALVSETLALAARITRNSQFAVRLGKASYYRQVNQPLDAAYRSTSADLVCNLMSTDGQEGLNAFIEKRTPVWQDR